MESIKPTLLSDSVQDESFSDESKSMMMHVIENDFEEICSNNFDSELSIVYQ